MFHAFDNTGVPRSGSRAEWMALLARAPMPMLEEAVQTQLQGRSLEWLRRPETGLYMIQGRAGGTGERFNLGEVTVTRCALRSLDAQARPSPVGVSYVLGRHHRHAELAALADALLQLTMHHEVLQQTLLEPLRQHLRLLAEQRQRQVQSSKVDFFTVARESTGGEDPA